MALTRETFLNWLEAYRTAWASLDADAVPPLFAAEAVYFPDAFEAPKRGRDAICEVFADALKQREAADAKFEMICTADSTGWAHWSGHFTRRGTDDPVRVDGILKASFEDNQCVELREWWHRLEPGQGDLMRDFDA